LLKQVGWLVAVALAVVVAVALVLFVWSRWLRPVATPVQASPAVTAVPGDVYIGKTSRDYMTAVVAGEPRAIKRCYQTIVDPEVVRAETLGRFASVPAAVLKVGAVHDEQAVSGRGASQPASSWSAVVTMEVTQASQVETFGVQVTGSYGANGAVVSSMADASAQ